MDLLYGHFLLDLIKTGARRMNTSLRQISQLCWKIVNELREANKMLAHDMPVEFSKVYEIADEIEDWLIMENEE
tara:strand:+ start:492 stop:713 length:222 start_codon:yes stop_codon:yes gene_type:complete